MNPFLEDFWPDVHTSLMVYLRNALQPILPAGLVARVEECLTIDAGDESRLHRIRADVLIADDGKDGGRVQTAGPVTVTQHDDYYIMGQEVERRVEIVDLRGDGEVITVIEVLSRTNKTSGARAYREKSDLILEAGANLVEIDLLRTGQHVVSVPMDEIPSHKLTPYLVCAARGRTTRHVKVWHIGLLQRLPTIAVPLRPTDPAAVIDLQPLLDSAYRDGGYDHVTNYRKPLTPPLPSDALARVEEYLRSLE